MPRRLDTRTIAFLAFADELVARPGLLATFAEAFGDEGDATLVIVTGAGSAEQERLLTAAAAVGLRDGELPDLLLLPLGDLDAGVAEQLSGEIDAVLSQDPVRDASLAALPRFGMADAEALRRHGAARLAAAEMARRLTPALARSGGDASRPTSPPAGAEEDRERLPDVALMSEQVARDLGLSHIVALGGAVVPAAAALGREQRLIGMGDAADVEHGRNVAPTHTWLPWRGDQPLPSLPAGVLERSLVLCDVPPEWAADPSPLLAELAELRQTAPVTLLTAPADRWPPEEFDELLAAGGLQPSFTGLTRRHAGAGKDTLLAVLERDHRIERAPPGFRVVAVLNAFNEGDIIEQAILKLVDGGVAVRLVDNWSTDGSVERVEALGLADRVAIERFPPDGPTGTYDWARQLANTERIAAELGEGWVMHHDADEIRRPPWPGVSMRDALWHVQQRGFNAINHTVMHFRPTTVEPFTPGEDHERRMRHLELESGANLQVKAWDARVGRVDLASSGGHLVAFPGRRIFPWRFELKHYPVRSQEHGERKLFAERKGRWNAEERARGWHVHYDRFVEGHDFVRRADELLRYDDRFLREYVVERLTGVGIVD